MLRSSFFFMESSSMSILPAISSALPLPPIIMLCSFIFICYKLFPKIIPHSIFSKYITPTAAGLAWAWDFLLHHSFFPKSHQNLNFPGHGAQGLSLRLYKPELGWKEAAGECAVCLCKIEEGEETRELRCAHIFHRDCLDRWVGHRNGTCPLCRSCLAPPRIVNEVGEEVIVLKFFSFSSSNRSAWWLR